ncbi:hypothetical protein CRYUN_Cryun19dG0162600 [Craigia yunnanensis]
MSTPQGSNKNKVLYDEFLSTAPNDDEPSSPFNSITEKFQSVCNFNISPGSSEQSYRGDGSVSKGDSDKSLIPTPEQQEKFLKDIYEPVERSMVHGFDYDEKSLKMFLLSQDSFKLIGVVGVLGVGKTTLCRLIFNEEEVKQRFVPRIWIPLSEEPKSMEKVVERMLVHIGVQEDTIKSISESISGDDKLPGLLYALYLQLKGKRFLIVLDDVRVEDKYYTNLVSCLSNGHGFPKAYGGAVIVTSRNEEEIKKMVGDQNLHRLLPLSDPESCWAIYKDASMTEEEKKKEASGQQSASKGVTEEANKAESEDSRADTSKEEKQESKKDESPSSRTDVSKEVKEELKKKCGGFPLAARMMGKIKQLEKKRNDSGSNQASTISNECLMKNDVNQSNFTKDA